MDSIKTLKNIVFSETEREVLTADLYLPSNAKNTPIVILVHGGAFQAGSKEMYSVWGPHLAKNGICAMAINYRLATPTYASYPDIIDDMFSAIRYLVKNSYELNLDTNNISFVGDSAGAYLGAMVALKDTYACFKVKLVVSIYGVLDIIDWADYTNATRTDYVITKMFGADSYTAMERYKAASPILEIEKSAVNPLFTTEFMIVWGEMDEIVKPENQSIAFVNKLKQLNIKHTTLSIPDMGHFWFTSNTSMGGTSGALSEYPISIVEPKIMEKLKEVFCSQVKSDPNSID